MESEYPGNSRFGTPRAKQSEEKKVEKVTTGRVVVRKKSLGRRFVDIFVLGDARSVRETVFIDVIMPAIKDTLADAASQMVEQILFGQSRSAARRTGYRPSSGGSGYVSYNRYTNNATAARTEATRPAISQRGRAMHDLQEIVLENRRDAMAVIESLQEIIEQYDMAPVSDFYKLVGENATHADEKWGWTDLTEATVVRRDGGYTFDLPKPEPLN